MQLSFIFHIFTSLAVLFGAVSGVPVDVHHPSRTNPTNNVDKRQLQVLVDVAVIVNIAKDVVDGIEAIIDAISGDISEAEAQYTTGIVSSLRAQYPTMNVLVFHDQDSGYELYSATHAHVEFDIALGFTKGYEIWVFDYGWFELAGDGGYENWAIGGSFDREDSYVTFYSMNGN
jgi:hypothetical protein